MKSKICMFNFIVDYKTKDGQDKHQAFQVFALKGMTKVSAANLITDQLKKQGYYPTSVLIINGDYTLPELEAMADNPVIAEQYLKNFEIKNAQFIPY